MSGRRSARPGRDRGQATAELALGLPVLALSVLLVLQLALVGRDLVLTTHAAREAARAVAVGGGDLEALAAARASSGALDPHRIEVAVSRRRGAATVEVRYRSITGLPLVGVLVPDRTLAARATMREEPP